MLETTEEQKKQIYPIAKKMIEARIDKMFVYSIVDIAEKYEGAFDLMVMWDEETDLEEKRACLADLKELIFDELKYKLGVKKWP